MLEIKTDQGISQITVYGEPVDIACDCMITTVNVIRQYAKLRDIPEGKAAIEVTQEILKYFSGNWREKNENH